MVGSARYAGVTGRRLYAWPTLAPGFVTAPASRAEDPGFSLPHAPRSTRTGRDRTPRQELTGEDQLGSWEGSVWRLSPSASHPLERVKPASAATWPRPKRCSGNTPI